MQAYPGIAMVEVDGQPTLAVVVPEGVIPLAGLCAGAPADTLALIADWRRWEPELRAIGRRVAHAPGVAVSHEDVAWLPPLVPHKLLCVGSNYHDHVAEMTGPANLENRPAPFPFSFLKPETTLVGSGRAVTRPSYGRKLDWEAELAVIIGEPTHALSEDPLRAVFGYTILNDLSLRDFLPFPHTLGLDAVVSKGFDGAAPMGPWITVASDVPDPQNLPIRLRINGELRQDGTTANMIFGVADLVRHYARVMTLQPGDVIATGTPAGVGAGRKPPRFLMPGDVVEIQIGNLGTLRTTIDAPAFEESLDVPATRSADPVF